MIKTNNNYNIDCRKGLKQLYKQKLYIDSIITSPPFYSVRKYDIEEDPKWNDGYIGQLGLEPEPDLYIKHLCDIFDLAKRILKNTGNIWVNLGDTYNNSKSLLLIPERFAVEMINRGWILRNVIIWRKPNVFPESISDRFTIDFEYLYFFTKNNSYYFKQQFEKSNISLDLTTEEENKINTLIVKYKDNYSEEKQRYNSKYNNETVDSVHEEQHLIKRVKYYRKASRIIARKVFPNNIKKQKRFIHYIHEHGFSINNYRNKRCIWDINTSKNKFNHYATFPEELIEIPIKAGSPKKNGIILDIFSGIGTTLRKSWELGRSFIGFELSTKYYNISKKYLEKCNYMRF